MLKADSSLFVATISKVFSPTSIETDSLNLPSSENSMLFAHIGYKTKGYLPGESLYSGPITRNGFSINF